MAVLSLSALRSATNTCSQQFIRVLNMSSQFSTHHRSSVHIIIVLYTPSQFCTHHHSSSQVITVHHKPSQFSTTLLVLHKSSQCCANHHNALDRLLLCTWINWIHSQGHCKYAVLSALGWTVPVHLNDVLRSPTYGSKWAKLFRRFAMFPTFG